jgi:hypothetical protein
MPAGKVVSNYFKSTYLRLAGPPVPDQRRALDSNIHLVLVNYSRKFL